MAKKIKNEDFPQTTLKVGDCVKLMSEYVGQAHLLIADPPYNYGQTYDLYEDSKTAREYLEWTKSWLAFVPEVLHKHGSFWCFAPDEWVADIDVICRRDLGLYRRSWVVWYYTFGVANQKNFSRSHTHILYYTKTKTQFTFNDAEIRVKSARAAVYGDPRQNPKGKLPDNTWVLLRDQLAPYLLPDQDTWLESRICGTYKERKPHSPNQIPEPVIDRIVRSTSNRGDLVLDNFLGTGTTGVVCRRLGRHFVGMDISKECVEMSKKRIYTL